MKQRQVPEEARQRSSFRPLVNSVRLKETEHFLAAHVSYFVCLPLHCSTASYAALTINYFVYVLFSNAFVPVKINIVYPHCRTYRRVVFP
jgi:hypothetical protein